MDKLSDTNILIRVDASEYIGSGHVMRCLALSNYLENLGAKIVFICRRFLGHMGGDIQSQGYEVIYLDASDEASNEATWLGVPWKQDVDEIKKKIAYRKFDWLIVDHYGIDYRWHEKMSNVASRIMVIDDLANRRLYCNVLLDQTYSREAQDYQDLVPKGCRILVGSEYTLLRSEFARSRYQVLDKRLNNKGNVKNILLAMGGADFQNITSKIIDYLEKINWTEAPIINVIIGCISPHLESINKKAEQSFLNVNVFVNVDDMTVFLSEADVGIGAGGTSCWERCCLGLPTLLVKTAENQSLIIDSLIQSKAAVSLGDYQSLDNEKKVVASMSQYLLNNNKIFEIGLAAAKVCDGLGVYRTAQHVLPTLLGDGKDIYLRSATINDAKIMHRWQSIPKIRQYARNPEVPTWEEHISWLKKKLSSINCIFNIIMVEDVALGILRLDRVNECDSSAYEISIIIAPEGQSMGIGFHSLLLSKRMVQHSDIVAEIHHDNLVSRHLFKKAGFMKIKEGRYIYRGASR